MKLNGYKKITASIEIITGLHIGGSSEATQIGGLDNPIIKLQKNNYPFIPGSSLKGKMRSLLELYLDSRLSTDNRGNTGPHSFNDDCESINCPICYLFGASANSGAPIGPGRLIFRDCYVDEENKTNQSIYEHSSGLPYSEEKTEVVIDRIKGAAKTGGLRKVERVPAGVSFNMEITLRIFEGDQDFTEIIKQAFALIENDCLGGSGSRGYGRIKFNNLKIGDAEIDLSQVSL